MCLMKSTPFLGVFFPKGGGGQNPQVSRTQLFFKKCEQSEEKKQILVPLITPTILDYKQSLSGLCPKIAIVCHAVPIVEYYSNTSKVSGHLFRPSVNLFKQKQMQNKIHQYLQNETNSTVKLHYLQFFEKEKTPKRTININQTKYTVRDSSNDEL